jgi:hypothetical protein
VPGNGELRSGGTIRKGARRGEAERLLLSAIVIDESEAAAVRCQARRQRVIGDAGAADERHDRADVDQILGFDAQEMKPHAVGPLADKGYAGQTQKAGWVRRPRKAFEEGGFDKVEVDRCGINRRLVSLVRQMRRLPLQRLARGPIVAGGVRMVMMTVRPVMIVAAVMARIVVVMIVVHGQKLTGLSMIDLCLPRLPWATIEPSASTTTRTPNSAVMSDVS